MTEPKNTKDNARRYSSVVVDGVSQAPSRAMLRAVGFTEADFHARYGGAAYDALKKKYDASGAFPRLYEKCVLRA